MKKETQKIDKYNIKLIMFLVQYGKRRREGEDGMKLKKDIKKNDKRNKK